MDRVSEGDGGTGLGPLFPIAITLFYYDQRIRHEGFDIEMMMIAAGMNAPVNPVPGTPPGAAHVQVVAVEPEERPT